MKKLVIFCAMVMITGVLIFSCQKEASNPGKTTAQNGQTDSNSHQKLKPTLSQRTYRLVWDASGQWSCVCCGDNCLVSALAVYPNETINLSVIQVLKLMEIGNLDLNDYFVKNQSELRDTFPDLYEGNNLGQIASNKLKLTFEFPFLFFSDDKGVVQKAYNYETTLSDPGVVSALKAAAAGYDKKAELNTDVNNPVVWKCISAGDNCKTNASATFGFYPEWIASNSQYLYLPTIDAIRNVTLTKDRAQVEITTSTSKVFVFEI